MFQNSVFILRMPLAATGCLNGTLAIWDIPSQKLRHNCVHQVGYINANIWNGGTASCVQWLSVLHRFVVSMVSISWF